MIVKLGWNGDQTTAAPTASTKMRLGGGHGNGDAMGTTKGAGHAHVHCAGRVKGRGER